MNGIVDQLNQAGRAFVEFALPMLIQSGVLILILLPADLLLRKKVRAVFRYWMWMLVLVKLVLPTSLSSPISVGRWFGDELACVDVTPSPIPEPELDLAPILVAEVPPVLELPPVEAVAHSPEVAPAEPMMQRARPALKEPTGPPPAPAVPLSWQGAAFLIWLAVLTAMALLLVQRAFFVRRLVTKAAPADGKMADLLARCCGSMAVRRKVGLKISAEATSPAVCGLLKPVILVPKSLRPSLSSGELRVVLLHELAHIKRRDLWVNLAQTVLQIFYFYNLLLWLANMMIRRAREQAVDEMVLVAMGEKARQYPQTLVNVAKLAFKRPALSLRLIGVVESKSALTGRIKHILGRPIPKTAKLGIVGLLVILVCGTVLLPMAQSRWGGSDYLVEFTPHADGPPPQVVNKTLLTKQYDVTFAEGQKLFIVAELYQTGKPVRPLGCRILKGSDKPEKMSIRFTREYENEARTLASCGLNLQCGNQVLSIPEFLIETDEFYPSLGWDTYRKEGFPKTEQFTEFEMLLAVGSYASQERGADYYVWMPGYNEITQIRRQRYYVLLKMIPVSRLEHLWIREPILGSQLPDGTYLSGDSTTDQCKAIVSEYQQSMQRALTRERMPLPELTAHRYHKLGDPINIYADGMGSDQWKPRLDEIYNDGDVSPMFFLIDGKEYASRTGFGPFAGGGHTLHLPGELYVDSDDFHLPPGKHTVAYGWKNLDVVNPDDPDRAVHYDRLTTDAVEFEVVEQLPTDYYAEIYEEGWEEILRSSVETEFSDEMQRFRISGPLLAMQIKSLPFDIAFEIYAQAEGGEERFYAGRAARQANSVPYLMGCDRQVDKLNWDTVGQKRWRLILVPSRKVAMQRPPIHHYYGREFVTDWATFEKTDHFEENRRRAYVRDTLDHNMPCYGGTIKTGKPLDLDHLSGSRRGDGNESWPLPEGFELGWTQANGGTLRIDPDSNVRMLWLPQANASLIEVAAETRRRLVELPESPTTEINPPEGQRTLLAVRSSEGRDYFVTVSKVNETWANITWWPARGVDDGPFGRVVDKKGKGVKGATIIFSRLDAAEGESQQRTIRSEISGGFILPKMEPGKSIKASISAPGYEKLESVQIEHLADGTYLPKDLTFELNRLGAGKTPGASGSSDINTRRTIFLPDLEMPDANTVLDLASGQMLSAESLEKDRRHFEKLGKGDLAYEYAGGKAGLLCLRGATIQLCTNKGSESLSPDVKRPYFVGYFLDKVPSRYQITTAEGDRYEVRVLSAEKGDDGRIQIEYWRADAASQTNPQTDVRTEEAGQGKAKATFPSGVKVELVGLTRLPAEGQPRWRPDGSILSESIIEHLVAKQDPSADQDHSDFNYYAVMVSVAEAAGSEPRVCKWEFEQADGHCSHLGSVARETDAGVESRIHAVAVRFPKDVTAASLKVGISGSWETLLTFEDYGSFAAGDDRIVVERAFEAHGLMTGGPLEDGHYFNAAYNILDRDLRIIAVDSDGTEHVCIKPYGTSTRGTQVQGVYGFRNLNKKDVREYRVEVRPYTWVGFEDVSLQPGQEAIDLANAEKAKTDAELEQWLGQGQTRQIRQLILKMRNCAKIHEHCNSQVEAIAAMRELVRIGEPAVSELVSEMERRGQWSPPLQRSLIVFTLRAIGSPRAVPALIEALDKSKYRGDYGIYVRDDDPANFMLDNQHREPDEGSRQAHAVVLGCPVIEITSALEKITGHTEGHEHYYPGRDQLVHQVAQRWRSWWQQNEDEQLAGNSDIDVEHDQVAAAGHGRLIANSRQNDFSSLDESNGPRIEKRIYDELVKWSEQQGYQSEIFMNLVLWEKHNTFRGQFRTFRKSGRAWNRPKREPPDVFLKVDLVKDGIWYVQGIERQPKEWSSSLRLELLVAERGQISPDQYDALRTEARRRFSAVRKPDSKWTTLLSNGAQVELVGISNFPSPGKKWWAPDGSQIGYDPVFHIQNYPQAYEFRKQRGLKRYEVAFAISWPKCPNENKIVEMFTDDVKHLNRGGSLADNEVIVQPVKFTADQKTFDVKIRISTDGKNFETATFKKVLLNPNEFESVSGESTLKIAEFRGPASASSETSQSDLRGRIVDAAGSPVADAQVGLSAARIGVQVSDGKLKPIRSDVASRIVQTNAKGGFTLGQQPTDSFIVIVAHDKGFAFVRSEEFPYSHEIKLQRWGRIEGQLAPGRTASGNKIWMAGLPNSTWFLHKRDYSYETVCDSDGRFVFEKVPAGWFEVGYLIRVGDSGWSITSRTPVEVKAGETTRITLGGSGRPVVGRFVPPEGYDKPIYFGSGLRSLDRTRPPEPRPENYDRMSRREQQVWHTQWRKTNEYKQYRDAYWHDPNWRQYTFRINDDGSFRIEDVIAGKYDLTVWIEERMTGTPSPPEEIGSYYGTIEVPQMPGGRSDEPLELGELELAIHEPLRVGETAPLFEAKTLDGRDLKLIDYRGKYVLLSFWQPVSHPELDRLKILAGGYNAVGRLEVIGLGGNDTLEEVRKYVAENEIPWPQVFTGQDFKSGIAKDYRLPGMPWIFLIGPDGKIIATGLRGAKLSSTVLDVLESARRNDSEAPAETVDPNSQIENLVAKLWKAIDANDVESVSRLGCIDLFARDNLDVAAWIKQKAKQRQHILTEGSRDLAEIDHVWIRSSAAIAFKESAGVVASGCTYFFRAVSGGWVLYRMDVGRTMRPVDPDRLFDSMVGYRSDREAWPEYLEAAESLHRGTDRAGLATFFLSIGRRHPLTRRGQTCTELGTLLAQMVEEDERFVEPADVNSLSLDERIAYYVFKLRDVAEQEMFVPGKCTILSYPKTPNSPAVALRKTGRTGVPAMISLLKDRRPTRSVGLALNGGVVLRNCDVALEIIEAIAEQKFDKRTERGAFLSAADAKTAGEIIRQVKQWWQSEGSAEDAAQAESEDGRPASAKGTGKSGEPAWGPVVDGLQAGLELETDKRSYAVGGSVSFRFHIRNVSERQIKLEYHKPQLQDWAPAVHDVDSKAAVVLAPLGMPSGTTGSYGIAGARILEHILEPGEALVLDKAALTLQPVGWEGQVRQTAVFARAGKYRVRHTLAFSPPDGFPGKGLWRGQLTTGEVELEVVQTKPTTGISSAGLDETGASEDQVETVMRLLGDYVAQRLLHFPATGDSEAWKNELDAWCSRCAMLRSGEIDYLGYVASRHPDTGYRAIACFALGETKNARVADLVAQAIDDESPFVRQGAARALGSLRSEEHVPELLKLLEPAADPVVGASAAYALGHIGSNRATTALIAALRPHASINLRRAIISALLWIRDRSALPVLRDIASDPDDKLNNEAKYTIRLFEDPHAWTKAYNPQVEISDEQRPIFGSLDVKYTAVSTDPARMPGLFEERPVGSKSYHLGNDVTVLDDRPDRTVYYIEKDKVFYIQHDEPGSETLHYYGPFEGDPYNILGLKAAAPAGAGREEPTACRTPGELMDRFLELARAGDPAAGELFAENVAPEVTRLLQWYGGEANCKDMTAEYQQTRAELLAGVSGERRQFYKEVYIWPDLGDKATQVGPRAYARLLKSNPRGRSWLRILLMREGKGRVWQIAGLLNRDSGLSASAQKHYLNPWSPATHPAWGETTEYRLSADDLARGCYIDFDSPRLHHMTPGSNLTRATCVRLGIDGKCGSHEVGGGGGLIGIDLLVRNDGSFTWGFLTPLNVQLAPSLWDSFGYGGGGPFFFKTREGNIGVMGVSGDVNNYYIKFKMLNPACLGSSGTILRAVQADPRETAAYFLVGGLCRNGELDVSNLARDPELITKVKRDGVPFGPRRLDIVYADGGIALAVTSKFGGDDYRRFVLYLSKEADRWLVTDVQIEPKEQDGEALRNFLQRHPNARIVPSTERIGHAADTDAASDVMKITRDNLFEVARSSDYKVGPEWFRVAESADNSIYVGAERLAETGGEPRFDEVLDDWVRWKYNLDGVVDTDSAVALFETFCGQFDSDKGFFANDPRARAIKLICDKLDTDELMDRYLVALRSGKTFCSEWTTHNAFSIDERKHTGHEGAYVLPASLSAVWYALLRIDQMLDTRYPTSCNLIEEKLTPVLIEDYEKRERQWSLDNAVLLGGPAIAEFLLQKDWRDEELYYNIETLGSQRRPVNKWLLRLINLDDPAGEEFRTEHRDVVLKFADTWAGSITGRDQFKPPSFLLFDRHRERDSFAWRYWPAFLAGTERGPYPRLVLEFSYLNMLEPFVTTQMYLDCWIRALDELDKKYLDPRGPLEHLPAHRRQTLAEMVLDEINGRLEKVGPATKENRNMWSRLVYHKTVLSDFLQKG